MGVAVIRLKPYTLKELADMYGVSQNTFRKWIKKFEKEIGPKHGNFYTVLQVEVIFIKLGLPRDIRIDDWKE